MPASWAVEHRPPEEWALTERDRVRFGDTTIEYQVRRSKRRKKTIQVTVDGSGVRVAAPMRTPDRELRAFVRKRAAWIIKHSANARLAAAPKRFTGGETLPYLGRNVRVVVEPAGPPSTEVRFHRWRFWVAALTTLDDEERSERIRRAIVEWYRDRAAERIPADVERWLPRLGRGERPRVLIRDQRRRWGSCARDGTLRFSWRAMMLEPALIDYVVVHELAHLTHQNHSADFWDLVRSAMPDADDRRRRLREAGRSLPL